MADQQHRERLALNGGGRPRPQYHYFYGSTENEGENQENGQEETSLIGEELVYTDHEEEAMFPRHHTMQETTALNGALVPDYSSAAEIASTGFRRALIVVGLAVSMAMLLILFFPHSPSLIVPASAIVRVPFKYINRTSYGDPVEGFLNLDLFHPDLLTHNSGSRYFNFPFPTGAFWTNLVVPSPSGTYTYPAAVYPYAYRWSKTSLQISYPSNHRRETDSTISDDMIPDLTFSVKEEIATRHVTRFDPLSVSLQFQSAANKAANWKTTLVQGSPYATIQYQKATPVINALSIFKSIQCPGDDAEAFSDLEDSEDGPHRQLFGVCSIDESDARVTYIRGVQFILKTNEGVSWMIFSSEPTEFAYDNVRKNKVVTTSEFTGVMRLALIPTKDDFLFSSTGLRRLIYHAGVYPIGGDVTWGFSRMPQSVIDQTSDKAVNATSKYATLRFNFATETMTDNSLRPNAAQLGLLMLALPHHVPQLSAGSTLDQRHFDLSYRCIKGYLTPVIGSSWSMQEPLLDLRFDGPVRKWNPEVKRTILSQAAKDLKRLLPSRDEDIYGYGKQVARLAQIVHASRMLLSGNKSVNASSIDDLVMVRDGQNKLWECLEMLLTGQTLDSLLYDSDLGGIVALRGLLQPDSDFGNGRYNDHHFHYGYILYACAMLGGMNSTFVDTYGSYVDAIFFDVAYHRNKDSKSAPPLGSKASFPFARHKSWFDGHSFATGLFSFSNGKSQESSSEAVNCYYGAYLWSLVRHQDAESVEITDFTRLLLATEIRGAQTYWHMEPAITTTEQSNSTASSSSGNSDTKQEPSAVSIYGNNFSKSYMVGNLGMLDVNTNTWFGSNPLFVHMINVLPVTPATAVLFNKEYVQKEYPYLMSKIGEPPNAWKGYTISIGAILDSSKAWADAQNIVSYELDSALSKTQVFYWISTRPDFNVTPTKEVNDDADDAPSQPDTAELNSSSAQCEQHKSCSDVGLSGLCCPTGDGTRLGCCNSG